MKNSLMMEYTAFVYPKNSFYVADCEMLNFSTYGRNESEAIKSLEKSINKIFALENVTIKPLFQKS
ncbi:MAG: hypothetical protein WCK67_02540 [bacterium]